jgi:hypothetical protein
MPTIGQVGLATGSANRFPQIPEPIRQRTIHCLLWHGAEVARARAGTRVNGNDAAALHRPLTTLRESPRSRRGKFAA